MDFADKKECIIFDGEELALPPKRRRMPISRRIAVWVGCILLAAIIFLCRSSEIFAKADEKLHPNGENGNLGEFVPPGNVESSTDSGNIPFASEETEDKDRFETEGETNEESSEDTSCDVFSADLSYVERGDGYFHNYSEKSPDVEGLLEMGFSGEEKYYTERPIVLIIHSHINEEYYDIDKSDPSSILTKSVVAVGETIAGELYGNGISTVHCTVIHGTGGGNSYGDAAETISEMLRIYPSIRYVIDIHRMEDRDEDGRLLKTESSIGSGQIRLTASSKGEHWDKNLALALALRRELNEEDKRLCLPVVFTDVELNANCSPYYLKVDVGAAGNTAEEATLAGEYFARSLSEVLKGK